MLDHLSYQKTHLMCAHLVLTADVVVNFYWVVVVVGYEHHLGH